MTDRSSADIVDPADLWDRYCAETPAKRRSPQGAMAFAVDALTGDVAQPTRKYDMRALAKFLYEHCALDPDKAGDVAATVLSEYDVHPAAQPPAAPVETNPTLWGKIAAIYGELDAEDCAWIDREWAKMRGYILPTNGTSTLSRSSAGTDEATEGCGDVLLEAKKPGGEWVKIYPAQLEWMVELGYFARATQKVTE